MIEWKNADLERRLLDRNNQLTIEFIDSAIVFLIDLRKQYYPFRMACETESQVDLDDLAMLNDCTSFVRRAMLARDIEANEEGCIFDQLIDWHYDYLYEHFSDVERFAQWQDLPIHEAMQKNGFPMSFVNYHQSCELKSMLKQTH